MKTVRLELSKKSDNVITRLAILSILIILMLFPRSAFAAADPLASLKTQEVLDYLKNLPNFPDKRVLSGQFGWDTEEVDALYQTFGKYPALIGRDYLDFQADLATPPDFATANADLIAHWNAGGLVTMSYHFINPVGVSPWDTTYVDIPQLITPGTSLNSKFNIMLNLAASGLSQLQDAGVVVLWRPFHEMNGTWFWWGGKSASQYKSLWSYTFNYLTTTKRLHNLLWVWSPYESINTTYYPGNAYVDIVGVDLYGHGSNLPKVLGYDSLASIGKPFAITELGLCAGGLTTATSSCAPQDIYGVIASIKRNMPKTVFWLSWNGVYSISYNVNEGMLMADPWVITRDEIDLDAVPPQPPPPPSDTTPPVVSITSPRSGTTVYYSSGTTVTTTASDDTNLQQLRLMDNGTQYALKTVSGRSVSTNFSWKPRSRGNHNMAVEAKDASGNVTVSRAITIYVR
jgi:mannan endo-1,4-beta-mannosidase